MFPLSYHSPKFRSLNLAPLLGFSTLLKRPILEITKTCVLLDSFYIKHVANKSLLPIKRIKNVTPLAITVVENTLHPPERI